MNKFALPTAGLLLLSPLSLAIAQTITTPVIVTATRTAQTADASLAPVIVIDREEIEAYLSTDLPDLLRMQTGVEIGRNGGPGQLASVFMRGTDSNHTLVMIDGVRLNPSTIGGVSLQNIRPEMIERIEIVKGPRSTLYGSDAIGGVINIITRRADSGSQADVRAGYGSYNTREVSVSGQHAADGVSTGINVSSTLSDGFSPQADAGIDSGYSNQTLNLHGEVKLGRFELGLQHWQSRGNSEYLLGDYDPMTYALTGYHQVDQDYNNSVTAVSLSGALSDRWQSSLKLSRLRDEITQNQLNQLAVPDYSQAYRDSFDWQNDIQLDDHLVSVGFYAAREKAKSQSWWTVYNAATEVQAAYLQDDFSDGPHHLIIGGRLTDHDSYGRHGSWNIDYGYQFNRSIGLTASAGSAFRSPDSTDRYGYGGNPDLDAETSRNLEIGLHASLGKSQRITASAFRNRIEDLIEFYDPDGWNGGGAGDAPGMMTNIQKAEIEGVELAYQAQLGAFGVSAGLTLQDPVNKTTGEPLARRAKESVNLGVSYTATVYKVRADVVYSGERQEGTSTLGDYTLLNLAGEYTLGKGLSLAGRLENLLDEDYQLAKGYNTAGRSAFLELRYRQ